VELEVELARIAEIAKTFADAGEELVGVVPSEPRAGVRVYVCSYEHGERREAADLLLAAAERRDDEDDQEEGGKDHDELGRAHQQRVHLPAGESGECADKDAGANGDRHG